MKRIFYFVLTNLAILAVIFFILEIFGIDQMLGEGTIFTLLGFSFFVGFAGSLISLFMSKTMAAKSVNAKIIDVPANDEERWLKEVVESLARRANIPNPTVAIYHGQPNAFATGASKNNSLVAVADGLLSAMSKTQVEAVLGHEITHISNGDMVTLTLIQGVVNTFVTFIARILSLAASGMTQQRRMAAVQENGTTQQAASNALGATPTLRRGCNNGAVFNGTYQILQSTIGALASMVVFFFSRKREYYADAGSGKLMGNNQYMIDALTALAGITTGQLPKDIAANGIAGGKGLAELFATHPSFEKRVEALKNHTYSN